MICHDGGRNGDVVVNAIRREKFATQVNAETLAEVRGLAETEGRQLQSLIDEALSDLLEKRRQSKPRAHVMNAYQRSHEPYSELYKKLAK
jgi:hypothetical protein